tara:strand:+ start:2557 stop:3117 length:561 start_codon:yes stop_codon:yes gene_type:complete
MNNKHLACLVVGLLVAAVLQWTNMSHQKLRDAQDLEALSRSSYDNAVIARVAEQRKMVILKNKTKNKRDYLSEWTPHINQIKNAQVGEALINMKIKESKIITLSQVFDTFDREKESAITRGLNAQLVLEDDYVKVFNWLANFEASVPAARVSSCKLTKGQSGNDLRMDLLLKLPITKDEGEKKTKA